MESKALVPNRLSGLRHPGKGSAIPTSCTHKADPLQHPESSHAEVTLLPRRGSHRSNIAYARPHDAAAIDGTSPPIQAKRKARRFCAIHNGCSHFYIPVSAHRLQWSEMAWPSLRRQTPSDNQTLFQPVNNSAIRGGCRKELHGQEARYRDEPPLG